MSRLSSIPGLIAAMICAVSCGSNPGQSSATDGDSHGHSHEATDEVHVTRAQTEIVGIGFGSPSYADIATTLHCTGRLAVDPADDASVTPLMPGVVRHILVKAGATVTAGQPVAEIENPEAIALQQQYLQARDRLDLASKELARQQSLAKQGAGIARNLQAASTEREIALTECNGLAERLRMAGVNPASVSASGLIKTMTVKAPISGTVSGISAGTGSYADGTQAIMTILNTSHIYCIASVFEKDLPLVAQGEDATASLLNNPATVIPGKIVSINPAIDPATKAVEVRINLSDLPSDTRLLPGMGVSVRLNTGHHRELTLPSSAIISEGGKDYVFLVEEEEDDELHLVKTPVVTGVSAGGITAILPSPDGSASLTIDSKVVTDGTFYITSMAADHGEHNH